MDGTTSLKEWGAYDATAKALAHVKTHRLGDQNHAQLVEDDAVAYISSRSTNGIVKVNTTDDATVWVLGGEYGHFNITDFDGTTYPPGATLWAGQHNAEYFGDAEFCMFDNQYDMGNNSRLLCVTIDDEDARLASLTWEYQFDDYSTHFGDNDRLPTGNMLGATGRCTSTAATSPPTSTTSARSRSRARAARSRGSSTSRGPRATRPSASARAARAGPSTRSSASTRRRCSTT